MKMKFLALAAVYFALSLDSARAQESHWFGYDYDTEGDTSLGYGIPDSDGVGISFNCNSSSHELKIWFYIDSVLHPYSDKEQLATVTVSTTPSTERFVMNVSLFNSEMEDLDSYAEGHGRINVSLARMLKQGKTLNLTVGKEKMSFPLKGAAAAMKPLVDCAEAPH